MNSNQVIIKGYSPDFKASQINIDDMRKLDSANGPSIPMANITYGPEKKQLLLQTPIMKTPFVFGKGYSGPNGSGDVSQDLCLSFGAAHDTDEKMIGFKNNLKSIEKHIIHHAAVNREKWNLKFKDKPLDVAEERISEIYNCFAKTKDESKYPPMLKIKIPYDKNTKMYKNVVVRDLHTKEQYDFNEIKDRLQGARIKACFRLAAVYNVNSTQIGVSPRMTHFLVEFQVKEGNHEFLSTDDEEETKKKSSDDDLAEDVPVSTAANITKAKKFIDSEDEDYEAIPKKKLPSPKKDDDSDNTDNEEIKPAEPEDSDNDTDDEDTKSTKKTTQKKKPEPEIEDSDNDSDEEEEVPVKKTTKKKVTASKKK